jgi:DNA-binding NarL/FixJ family response regulator
MPIKIIIADDHEVFREGFRSMLRNNSSIEIIGEAEDGVQVLNLLKKVIPDILVLDIKMPRMDGIECLKQVQKKYPSIDVIMLTMFDSEDLIIAALNAGAKGYLIKNAHKSEILSAIQTCSMGDHYYCSNTTKVLAELLSNGKISPFKLTKKTEFSQEEKEFIELIIEGFGNNQIALHLKTNVRNVEKIREALLNKMGVRNNAGIVMYAIKNQIVKI